MPRRDDLTKLFNLCFEVNSMIAHKVMASDTLLAQFNRATTSEESDIKDVLANLIEEKLTDEMIADLRIGRGVDTVAADLALITIMRTELVAQIAERVIDDKNLRKMAQEALNNQNDAEPLSADETCTYLTFNGAPVLGSFFSPKPRAPR